jgi:ATP-dependent Clp protease ATP-binding subunit ClpA
MAGYNDDDNLDLDVELDAESEEDVEQALEVYGTDLTVLARKGLIDECFGRDKELLQLMEILVRRQKNNPVLVGNAGVGKTAIIELFASKIVNNLVPFVLEGRNIISLDLARIVAGSRYRGEFELRFQKILDEVLKQPNIIIFIDEIHNITGMGSTEGSLDAANILKPALSRSGFQCIGATTPKEYEQIEKDPALNRRFQPIIINEPTVPQTVDILYGLRPSLESFHNVNITPAALKLSADLSSRYIYDRFLPDKAIDLIDRAAAKEVIKLTNVTEGSVLSGIVNTGLINLSKLRLEAFRRGDAPLEFILHEVENAYRNFLLRWIESPSKLPETNKTILSPIEQGFFDTMRLTVLKRVDDLFFSENEIKKVEGIPKMSAFFDESIILEYYQKMRSNIYYRQNDSLSLNKLLLFILGEWLMIEQRQVTFYDFSKKLVINYNKSIAHLNGLVTGLKTFEILSQLETTRINVFKEYLTLLKPVLRRGLIQSMQQKSELNLSDDEYKLIYALLGYLSTEAGHNFLINSNDPNTLNIARKTGDFSGFKKSITQEEIRTLISDMTGIPIKTMTRNESQELLNLEEKLHKRVIGQEEAILAISKSIRRARLGLQNPNRPIASFMFCGPTGVGKTEVTKALAANIFGSEKDMIRFDMSEFMEKFTISRMIGSPPGYVGYDEGGQLTDAVRRKPYSVVLFDEIEKAHPDILNILLQILEDGRLTDSQKRLVKFDNTIIIMTSNAAANEIQQIIKTESVKNTPKKNTVIQTPQFKINSPFNNNFEQAVQFIDSPITENFFVDINKEVEIELKNSGRSKLLENNSQTLNKTSENNNKTSLLKSAVLKRLSTIFLPEFLNRLDDIIIFEPLKKEELRQICDIMITDIEKRISGQKMHLEVLASVKNKMTHEGYNPLFGARPLRRVVTKSIEDLISEYILNNPIDNKEIKLKIYLNENDKINIKSVN